MFVLDISDEFVFVLCGLLCWDLLGVLNTSFLTNLGVGGANLVVPGVNGVNGGNGFIWVAFVE